MRVYLRILFESLHFAIQALVVNRLRTLLSLLGVTIGIFAIISVFTLVDTLERNIRSSIEELGDNVVFVQKWPWEFGGDYPWWKYMNRPHPDLTELEEIEKRSELASAVSIQYNFAKTIEFRNNSIQSQVIEAVSDGYPGVRNINLQSGRFITQSEFDRGAPVCVIGDYIAYVIFGNVNPVGREMKIGGRKVTVAGVFEKEGESMIGMSMDENVIISTNLAKAFVNLKNRNLSPTIYVKAKKGIPNAALKDELFVIMRSIRRLSPTEDEDFALNEISILSEGFDDLFGFVNIVGLIIGGFSILVGGFGIANIMFVSVKERTNIIGIEKSLGAKNNFILMQFLGEAVMLCVVGGSIGLLFIWFGALAGSAVTEYDIVLSLKNVITGLSISVVIGLLAGIIPAYSAARLNPVDAIRAKG
ncbi:ABC transporter permease [Salibacter halophilus]|uniref:FtsX-like permease family protein n=1 Tax=Salibacter halophilus TaxID=1803916 RepID=A0A6N6M6F1_9FLAO|nr:ABC transporter permease [Salibacter halophilus]KAB1063832.1 FtsX-like permease family protein [Salibacter halophilus]